MRFKFLESSLERSVCMVREKWRNGIRTFSILDLLTRIVFPLYAALNLVRKSIVREKDSLIVGKKKSISSSFFFYSVPRLLVDEIN